MKENITVTISLKEFELVLNSLAQLPYAQVAALLAQLVAQANAQRTEDQVPLDLNPEDTAPPVS